MLNCPECTGAVTVPEFPRVSETVECGECHVELEILALDPVMVALAPEIEEDWGE
jgi:alpha-aminoadipate carrier protein LysW